MSDFVCLGIHLVQLPIANPILSSNRLFNGPDLSTASHPVVLIVAIPLYLRLPPSRTFEHNGCKPSTQHTLLILP